MDIEKIIKKLIDKNLTIVTAESITGGYIAKCITDVPGSSSILKESFVVYSNEAKVNLLNVDANLINKYGVVSNEVAIDMAKKLYELTGRNICVATTGNAGPSVCDDKPVGRVYIGICYNGSVKSYECNFVCNGDAKSERDFARLQTVYKVFEEIDMIIK